jgi:hypothetical protein
MDDKDQLKEFEFYERLWNLWKNEESFSDFPVLLSFGLPKETIDNMLLSLNLFNKSSLNKEEFYKVIGNIININLIEKGRKMEEIEKSFFSSEFIKPKLNINNINEVFLHFYFIFYFRITVKNFLIIIILIYFTLKI